MSGVATDLLGDRAVRVLPLTDLDAAELVRAVRAAPLLFGYRGSEPVDVDALEPLLLRRRGGPTTCPSWPSWS